MTIPETVEVTQGRLRGVRSEDGAAISFKGIPFALPPVGDLRWRPPQPAASWDGVRPANAFGPHAIQMPHFDHLMGGDYGASTGGTYGELDEDCLYLNVFSAACDPDQRLPVMVWLHHGAFFYGGSGAPAYDGENLARAGAVVVTINYRLGRLGFMAHPQLSEESPDSSSSNYGLLDQIAALEWVRENIAAFGGDPECVTIFGLSAGSASVSLLMASPLARGLFHRAIGQSAALMGPTAPTTGLADLMQDLDSAERTGLALARALDRKSIDELRRCPAKEILAIPPLALQTDPPDVQPWSRGGKVVPRGHLDSIYPIVDGHVLPKPPFEIFEEGAQADVPLLTGSGSNEAASLPYITDLAAWIEDSRFEYGASSDRFLELFRAAQDDVKEVSGASRGDRVFVWQAWRWIRLHARTGKSPCFYYHWTYEPPVRVGAEFVDKTRGAFHGVELPYVFRNLEAHAWPWRDSDRALRDVVSSYWLNFARTGDPNADELPSWTGFDDARPTAMHFSEEPGMGPIPRMAQMDFWDDWYGTIRR